MDDLNKWTLYNQLIKCNKVNIFLPQTAYITKPEIVFDMLHCYKSVFIKPCIGHGGQYIIHIYKIKRDVYKFYLYNKDKIYCSTISYIDLETMILKQIFYRDCIVQRDIKLAKHDGKFVNIRIRVQKNLDGFWQCTRIFGKIAVKGSTITSLETGASVIAYNKLQLSCSIHKGEVKTELYDLSTHVAKYLGGMSQYSCISTWGIDIAIDCCGGIWFIDASLKDCISIPCNDLRETCVNTIDQGIYFLSELRRILQ